MAKCKECGSLVVTLYFREYRYNQSSIRNVGDIDSKARVWRRTKAKYCKKCKKIVS